MKTHKHLFTKILSFENLLLAAHKAAVGKREQPNVMLFFDRLEENLWRLQEELQTQTYRPGEYSTFQIYEPKPRMISAAPFHDRVVHHALINVIGPLFERSFIFDSDYFPGDDLFTPVERRKGLPIGNLTSQFFANLYLDPLDHFIKEVLRCLAYLRYVDDFVLFANSKAELWKWREQIAIFLQGLRLKPHPHRCYIFPARVGWRFLGQQIFRTHRLLAAENVRRFKKRQQIWRKSPPDNLEQRLASWKGHAGQADTYRLLQAMELL